MSLAVTWILSLNFGARRVRQVAQRVRDVDKPTTQFYQGMLTMAPRSIEVALE